MSRAVRISAPSLASSPASVVQLDDVPAEAVAGGFRGVHRHVGAALHLDRVLDPAGAGDADAGPDQQVVRTDLERPAHLGTEPGHHRVADLVGRVGQQDGELVAAHPGHQVAVAQQAGQPLGHRDQQPVADRVPETGR